MSTFGNRVTTCLKMLAKVVIGSVYCMWKVLFVVSRSLITKHIYVAGTHSMAFVAVPNEELGKKLAIGLVENKLAACVNIIPGVKSIYNNGWKGNVIERSELILMIKTRTSRVDDVADYVRANHSYDVAEVISAPIQNGNTPYLDWIGQIVPQ